MQMENGLKKMITKDLWEFLPMFCTIQCIIFMVIQSKNKFILFFPTIIYFSLHLLNIIYILIQK